MKSPVLIVVEGDGSAFAALFAAAEERGLRFGWLELDSPVEAPAALAPFAGAFRAVAVGSVQSVAVKPRKGPAVLRDLLREHFLGADVVLVRGLDAFPRLTSDGKSWKLSESSAVERQLTLEELLSRLRAPAMRWGTREEERR